MKREAEIKELLVNNAIHLIAAGGFEMATTKELTHSGGSLSGIKMNEIYIYRLFGSKENLYAAAFGFLDNELFEAFNNAIDDFDGFPGNDKDKLYEFFLRAWRFVLKNEDRCRCYVRYYYSIYFKGESFETHNKRFITMLKKLSHHFKDEADVYAIFHSVFIMLFDFAIRVYNGEIEDNDINRPHVFNVLYCMMATYLKEA